jgi:REP element-mobilizing transposase RayT
MEFVDPRTTPFVPLATRGELPHLGKPGGFYFVTFRVADAILARPEQHYQSRAAASRTDPLELARDFDPPIQAGSRPLSRTDLAEMVQNTLLHFEAQRYSLIAWCVMPNHVHVVFAPIPPYELSQILHSWKSFSAKRANSILGATGAFWERESFDHLIRNEESLLNFIRYTEDNPVEAALCTRAEDWKFSSAGQGFRSTVWTR